MLPGDFIRPFGHDRARSLNDYLSHRQVDVPFRRQIPLVCLGSEVLLVCGIGAGAVPLWHGRDETWIRLTWSGRMPWLEGIR